MCYCYLMEPITLEEFKKQLSLKEERIGKFYRQMEEKDVTNASILCPECNRVMDLKTYINLSMPPSKTLVCPYCDNHEYIPCNDGSLVIPTIFEMLNDALDKINKLNDRLDDGKEWDKIYD